MGKITKRPNGIYSNELYSSQMIDFIRNNENDGKPWFAWVTYTTGHMPIQAPAP